MARSIAGVRKVHVMGVGGTAMTAMAGMFREAGCEVRGSDSARPYPPMGDLLARLGIEVMHPYAAENLAWEPDLVVIGNVIRRTNPEAVAVMESDIRHMSMPDALREFFLAGRRPLVIAGTHGKTTTTSLTAHLLHAQGFDPSFLVGGIPLDFMSNYRLGGGEHFVVEGDEYDTVFYDKTSKFLHYSPSAAIINNIEFDHADIFRDLPHVIEAFAAFARLIPAGEPLLVPDTDANCRKATAGTGARVVTFGLETGVWMAKQVRWQGGQARFLLTKGGRAAGDFVSPMIGEHNLLNCVAALALLFEVGAVTAGLSEALASFAGVRKRQEVKGVAAGVTVIDDFAHHPTAVRETIRSVRCAFPDARLIALFEPESNTSRRRVFQRDYVKAFSEADLVLFATPFEKPDGLAPDQKIDMDRLCADIAAAGGVARMIRDIEELAGAAASEAVPGDVVLGMSGRDFHGVHDLVLKELRAKVASVH